MAIKRLQNRIAESRFALTATAVYALLVCLPQVIPTNTMWPQLGLLAVSVLLIEEVNNAHALVRVFSRMVSCSFLVLSIADIHLLSSLSGGVVQLCYILFYFFFFKAYQDKKVTGYVFYAFLWLGIASLFFVQILLIVPVLWILLFANMLAGSFRTFAATLLGLIAPYWVAAGYLLYQGDIEPFALHFQALTTFVFPFPYDTLPLERIVFFAFLVLVAAIGIVHFLRKSFLDKIKTRMIYEALIVIDIAAAVLLALQPQYYDALIRLMIVTTSPLIGHFITLTSTRATNVVFIVLLLCAVSITFYTLWML